MDKTSSPIQNIIDSQLNNQIIKLSGYFKQSEKTENQLFLSHMFSNKVVDGQGCILDGDSNSVRILKIDNAKNLMIQDMTFKNGNTAIINSLPKKQINFNPEKISIFEFIDGAGILITNNSTVTFINCIFESNVSIMCGGGVSIQRESKAVFKNCMFKNNTAGHTGSAIDNLSPRSELIVDDCVFVNNRSNTWNSNGGPHGQVSLFPHTKAQIIKSTFKGEIIPIDYQNNSSLKVSNNIYESTYFNHEYPANKGTFNPLIFLSTSIRLYPMFFKTLNKVYYGIR